MEYAVEDLSEVASVILDVNPGSAQGRLDLFYLESQLFTADRMILKSYLDNKILRGIGKQMGMEKTGLLDKFLEFDRRMTKIDFYVGFETWMITIFCQQRNMTLVTENKAALRLCNMWSISAVSISQFGYIISVYGYEGITVKKEF